MIQAEQGYAPHEDASRWPPYKSGFNPVLARDLEQQNGAKRVWVCDGYFAEGGLVVLASKPKVGKSTLTYQLAVQVSKGLPFLGLNTQKGNILILALEEHPADVKARLEEIGGMDCNIYIASNAPQTDAVFYDIKDFCQKANISLIIVDTLTAYWNVKEENDAAEVSRVIKPLLKLARESGACVLLIHHARKEEGSDGDEIRGSGALFALVDVGLVMKRHGTGKQRKLLATSRYSGTPKELTIVLDHDGEYTLIGSSDEAVAAADREHLKDALTSIPETIETLGKKAGLSEKKTRKHAKELVDAGAAYQQGEGTRGDPFRFRVRS
jgi:predicted ATP-dependent serine protease